MLRARPLLLVAVLSVLTPGMARAQEGPAASASASASAARPSAPLPELPKLAPLTHAEPEAAARDELASLLERLTAEDARTRENARASLAEPPSTSLVDAIHARIQLLRTEIDRADALAVLEDARKEARKKRKGKDKDDDEGEWLDFVLAKPAPRVRGWRDLVRLLAMQQLLAADGGTPAVREMLWTYAYFGDLVRVDLQRKLMRLKDKAVPALIEARQHDAKMLQRWASLRLEDMGKAIPGEAVSTNDTQILADVLRAYGRTRDVDALRVILSFCDHDRAELRQAAREATTAIGEPGLWQLRDAYLGMTGEKPPRGWTWDRVARELFGMQDQARLAEVHALMDQGAKDGAAGRLEPALEAFDKVLARVPLYDRRAEMAPIYVARAAALADERPSEALGLYRKALRLDPKAPNASKLEAEIAYLEGLELVAAGTPDKLLFARALELDPAHERARAELTRLGDQAVQEQRTDLTRYGIAGGIAVLALLAVAWLGRGLGRKNGGGGTGNGAQPRDTQEVSPG